MDHALDCAEDEDVDVEKCVVHQEPAHLGEDPIGAHSISTCSTMNGGPEAHIVFGMVTGLAIWAIAGGQRSTG